MDQSVIVDQVMHRCKQLINTLLDAQDLQDIAAAFLVIFERIREVARAVLQAKIDLAADRLTRQAPLPCCPPAAMTYVHTRTVNPTTLFGTVTVPVRTFRCTGCGATTRLDDAALGVPVTGEFMDDVRMLYTPLAAEFPHRVSNDIFARFTGVHLSSRGAQRIIDSSAADLQTWRATADVQETRAVAERLGSDADASRLRLELAMDGVKAHIYGRWQEPKVATILIQRLPKHSPQPIRGAVLARRYVCVFGRPRT